MDRYPLKNSFTRQFRDNPILHSDAEAMRWHNLLFQTFDTNLPDIHSLGQLLAPQLHNGAIVHRLQDKLTNHDIPDFGRLHALVEKIIGELAAQDKAEPYTTLYYNHLTGLLHSFRALIDAFSVNGLQIVTSLSSTYFTPENNLPVNGEAVSDVYSVVEDHLYQIMEYFQHFDLLLQKEAASFDKNARVQVKSYVTHYLDTILHRTEQLISNTDSTLKMLHAWKTALETREAQELYN